MQRNSSTRLTVLKKCRGQVSTLFALHDIINSWTKNKVETETPTLYEKGENLYFVVQLREEVRHFFLPGWFDDMTAPVTAVARLTKKNSNTPSTPDMPTKPIVLSETADEELIKNLTTLRNDNVIVGNWEVQYLYSQNKDDTITVEKNGEKYTINYTDANGNKIYKESEVDSLDVDFKWEVRFNQDSQYVIRAKDWDFTLDNAYAEVNTNAVSSMSNIDYVMKFDNGELNPALFMRIHATLNFDEPHKARVSYQYDDPDILWVRIESEPMYSEPDLYRENDDTKQKQNEKSYVDEAKRASSSKFSTSTNRITTRPRKNIAPLSFSTAAPKDTTPPTPYANQDPLS